MATLKHNLAVNKYPNAEFLILDYNSQDGLDAWMKEEFHMRLGADINFYSERTRQFFIMAHAKNVAALLASGDIIVNIDADQFMGPDFGHQVAEALANPNCVAWPLVGPWKKKNPSDAGGVLALRSKDFRRLGGYDEDMCHGWGVEDLDIKRRAVALGYRVVRFHTAWRFIRHSDQLRNQNTEQKLPKSVSAGKHRQIHREAMRGKRFVANLNRVAGHATVTRNFSTMVVVGMAPSPVESTQAEV